MNLVSENALLTRRPGKDIQTSSLGHAKICAILQTIIFHVFVQHLFSEGKKLKPAFSRG
jgi:hypothetical protein